MRFVNWSSVINLNLLWKQVFSYTPSPHLAPYKRYRTRQPKKWRNFKLSSCLSCANIYYYFVSSFWWSIDDIKSYTNNIEHANLSSGKTSNSYEFSTLLSCSSFLLIFRRPLFRWGYLRRSFDAVAVVRAPVGVFRWHLRGRRIREVAFVEGHITRVLFFVALGMIVLKVRRFENSITSIVSIFVY